MDIEYKASGLLQGRSVTQFMEEWKSFAKSMPVLKKVELTDEQVAEAKAITDIEELQEWADKNNLILYQVNPDQTFGEDKITTTVEFSFGRFENPSI